MLGPESPHVGWGGLELALGFKALNASVTTSPLSAYGWEFYCCSCCCCFCIFGVYLTLMAFLTVYSIIIHTSFIMHAQPTIKSWLITFEI